MRDASFPQKVCGKLSEYYGKDKGNCIQEGGRHTSPKKGAEYEERSR